LGDNAGEIGDRAAELSAVIQVPERFERTHTTAARKGCGRSGTRDPTLGVLTSVLTHTALTCGVPWLSAALAGIRVAESPQVNRPDSTPRHQV
jgi:hypothetical protein